MHEIVTAILCGLIPGVGIGGWIMHLWMTHLTQVKTDIAHLAGRLEGKAQAEVATATTALKSDIAAITPKVA